AQTAENRTAAERPATVRQGTPQTAAETTPNDAKTDQARPSLRSSGQPVRPVASQAAGNGAAQTAENRTAAERPATVRQGTPQTAAETTPNDAKTDQARQQPTTVQTEPVGGTVTEAAARQATGPSEAAARPQPNAPQPQTIQGTAPEKQTTGQPGADAATTEATATKTVTDRQRSAAEPAQVRAAGQEQQTEGAHTQGTGDRGTRQNSADAQMSDRQQSMPDQEQTGGERAAPRGFDGTLAREQGEQQTAQQQTAREGTQTAESRNHSAPERSAAPRQQSIPLPGRGMAAFNQGVARVVRFVSTADGHRARIVVEPPALGRVDVSLRSTQGGIEATLRVDSEALKQAVQGQLGELRNTLQQQGVEISELSVDVRQQEEHQSPYQQNGAGTGKGQRGKNGAFRRDGDETEEDETALEAQLDLERGVLHWVA
ncbi:MAG: flagellar hook-length control protein FliK, partial [Synergistales bacterium]|nr:flagellar hook-length control protein FliK [Synergistales bacterium]